MNKEDEDKDKEPEEKEVKRIYKTKDQILDESFRDAEILKTGKSDKIEPQKIVKKPFIKIGILIAIIALIGLVLINYMPFMYIDYETESSSITQFISHEDFRKDQIDNEEINSLFESTCIDCSDNSESYLGLKYNDFIDTPKFTIYVFYAMLITGIIFTIFVLIDRKKKFSENINIIIHSIFTSFIIQTGIIILILNMKFLNANLLQHLNKPFVKALGFNEIQILFFTPYFLIFISTVLFIIGLLLMKLNFNKAYSKYNLDLSKNDKVRFKFGSKI